MQNTRQQKLYIVIAILVITIICKIIKSWMDFIYVLISMIILIGTLFSIKSKREIGHSIIVTMFSLTINYIIFLISTTLCFVVAFVFGIQNDYINVIFIHVIQQSFDLLFM